MKGKTKMVPMNRAREIRSHQTKRGPNAPNSDEEASLDSSRIMALVQKFGPSSKNVSVPTSKDHNNKVSLKSSKGKEAEAVLVFPPCYICKGEIIGTAFGGVFRAEEDQDEDPDKFAYLCSGKCRSIFLERREATRLASYLAYVERQKAKGNHIE